MNRISFRFFKVECSQKGNLYLSDQRVQVKYFIKNVLDQFECIPDEFTCGFRDNSEECKKCRERIFSFVRNGCYVPEDTVIKLSQTVEDYPPIV